MITRFAAPAVLAAIVAISPFEAAKSMSQKLAPGLVESQRARQLADAMQKRWGTKDGLKELGVAKDFGGLADPIAQAARSTFQSYDATHAFAQAHQHLLVIAQQGRDAIRLEKELEMATMVARSFKSPAAESATVFMQSYIAQARSTQHEARSMRHGYNLIYDEYKRSVESGVGKLALDLEKQLLKSSTGRALLTGGKILAKPLVQEGLVAVGGIVAAQEAYHNSVSNREAVKYGAAVLAGTGNVAADVIIGAKILAGKWNPAVALYDPAMKYGSKAIGYGELGEKLTISKWIEGTANVYAGIAEAYWYGDSEALDRLHMQNMSGANGMVLQLCASAGDKISKSRVIDVAVDTVEFVKKVPDHFKSALAWWEAL